MKATRVIVLAGLAAAAVAAAAPDTFTAPAEGPWKGFAPGAWILRKSVTRKPDEPAAESFHKLVLVGESEEDGLVLASGAATEDGEFVKPPSLTRRPPGRTPPAPPGEPQPEVESNRKLQVWGVTLTVNEKRFPPHAQWDSGVTVERTVTELAADPRITLDTHVQRRDTYRDETYDYAYRETLTGVSSTNRFGRAMRLYHLRGTETTDGRRSGAHRVVRSDAIPGDGNLFVVAQAYGPDGKLRYEHRTEVIAMGNDAAAAAALAGRVRSMRRPGTAPLDLDSPAGRHVVECIMRQGLAEETVRDLASQVIRRDSLDYQSRKAGEIREAWERHGNLGTENGRKALLNTLQYVGSNRYGYIAPELEAVLNAIAGDDDVELRIRALTALTAYVPITYARRLEDAMVTGKQQRYTSALRCLTEARWGNPRRVLGTATGSVETLPDMLLSSLPEERAAAALAARYQAAPDHRRHSYIEHLGYYAAPKIRRILLEEAEGVTREAFSGTDIRRRAALIHLAPAVALQAIPGASGYLRSWLEWSLEEETAGAAKDAQAIYRLGQRLGVLLAAAQLRDTEVTAWVQAHAAELLDGLAFALHEENLLKLEPLGITLSPDEIDRLAAQATTPFGGTAAKTAAAQRQSTANLLRLVAAEPAEANLHYVMRKLVPEWTPGTDLSHWSSLRRKPWYTQRLGVEPPRIPRESRETLAAVLPRFGEAGLRLLVELLPAGGDYRHTMEALRRVPGRPDWIRKALEQLDPRSEEDREDLDLALWIYGNETRGARFREHVRFPPGHAVAGRVRRATGQLPFAKLLPMLEALHADNPDKHFPRWAAFALHHHVNQRSAVFMLELWDDTHDARQNPVFGELFNRMANRNFGMNRRKIREWIETLPE